MTHPDFTIPGEFLAQVHEYVARTGESLLRGSNATDRLTLIAWPTTDRSYDLSLEEEDDELSSVETWGDMADCLGIPLSELAATLSRRGFQWHADLVGFSPEELDAEEPRIEQEQGEDDDEAEPAELPREMACWEPWGVQRCLSDRGSADRPNLNRALAGIPGTFRWDVATRHPGLPAGVLDALDWLEGCGAYQGIAESWEMRSGIPEAVMWAPSAIAVSCLQHVLDRLGRGVRVRTM